MANFWIQALKLWNEQHNNRKWCVPKKGSKEYEQVRDIMDRLKTGRNIILPRGEGEEKVREEKVREEKVREEKTPSMPTTKPPKIKKTPKPPKGPKPSKPTPKPPKGPKPPKKTPKPPKTPKPEEKKKFGRGKDKGKRKTAEKGKRKGRMSVKEYFLKAEEMWARVADKQQIESKNVKGILRSIAKFMGEKGGIWWGLGARIIGSFSYLTDKRPVVEDIETDLPNKVPIGETEFMIQLEKKYDVVFPRMRLDPRRFEGRPFKYEEAYWNFVIALGVQRFPDVEGMSPMSGILWNARPTVEAKTIPLNSKKPEKFHDWFLTFNQFVDIEPPTLIEPSTKIGYPSAGELEKIRAEWRKRGLVWMDEKLERPSIKKGEEKKVSKLPPLYSSTQAYDEVWRNFKDGTKETQIIRKYQKEIENTPRLPLARADFLTRAISYATNFQDARKELSGTLMDGTKVFHKDKDEFKKRLARNYVEMNFKDRLRWKKFIQEFDIENFLKQEWEREYKTYKTRVNLTKTMYGEKKKITAEEEAKIKEQKASKTQERVKRAKEKALLSEYRTLIKEINIEKKRFRERSGVYKRGSEEERREKFLEKNRPFYRKILKLREQLEGMKFSLDIEPKYQQLKRQDGKATVTIENEMKFKEREEREKKKLQKKEKPQEKEKDEINRDFKELTDRVEKILEFYDIPRIKKEVGELIFLKSHTPAIEEFEEWQNRFLREEEKVVKAKETQRLVDKIVKNIRGQKDLMELLNKTLKMWKDRRNKVQKIIGKKWKELQKRKSIITKGFEAQLAKMTPEEKRRIAESI